MAPYRSTCRLAVTNFFIWLDFWTYNLILIYLLFFIFFPYLISREIVQPCMDHGWCMHLIHVTTFQALKNDKIYKWPFDSVHVTWRDRRVHADPWLVKGTWPTEAADQAYAKFIHFYLLYMQSGPFSIRCCCGSLMHISLTMHACSISYEDIIIDYQLLIFALVQLASDPCLSSVTSRI